MGMSIEDSIELFEDNFTVIDTHGHYTEEEETQATAIAIDTMRKYQKMQGGLDQIRAEILEDCGYSKDYVGAFTYSTIKVATVLQILDKYKAEMRREDGNEL